MGAEHLHETLSLSKLGSGHMTRLESWWAYTLPSGALQPNLQRHQGIKYHIHMFKEKVESKVAFPRQRMLNELLKEVVESERRLSELNITYVQC